jgi:hypothetical protein
MNSQSLFDIQVCISDKDWLLMTVLTCLKNDQFYEFIGEVILKT